MSLEDRNWTAFMLDAEHDHHGYRRMVSVHNALRARIAELEARLALAERVVRAASNVATEIEESTRGTTHWAYCEEFHPRCRWLLLLREAVAAYREETK